MFLVDIGQGAVAYGIWNMDNRQCIALWARLGNRLVSDQGKELLHGMPVKFNEHHYWPMAEEITMRPTLKTTAIVMATERYCSLRNYGLLFMFALLLLVGSKAVRADDEYHHRHERTRDGDYAQVVSVKPIVEQVQVTTPHRECREEEVTQGGNDGKGGAVLGAIAGGAIGNAAGHNTQSRRLDTVVGVVAGAVIGDKMAQSEPTTTTEEHCRSRREVQYEQKTVGYDVTYRYGDHEYNTRMDHDPGNEIRVVVDVHPAE
jgi:uncharacterized protein YcfJ